MKNEMILKYKEPIFTTYIGIAFMQGVILGYEKTQNEYFNNYLGLVIERHKHYVMLTVPGVIWEDYKKNGMVTKNDFLASNIPRENIIDFIKDKLQNQEYLLLFSIDEYYLSCSEENYQKNHFIHDTYIVGYEEDKILIITYTKYHLQIAKVDSDEIVNCLYNREQLNEVRFSTMKIKEDFPDAVINIEQIRKGLKDYVQGDYLETYDKYVEPLWGIDIYKTLKEFLNLKLVHDCCMDEKDLRNFRVLWEHKKMMLQRVQMLQKRINFDSSYVTEMEEIEKQAHLLFMLIMKQFLMESNLEIKNCMNKLGVMEKKEKDYYNQLLKVI